MTILSGATVTTVWWHDIQMYRSSNNKRGKSPFYLYAQVKRAKYSFAPRNGDTSPRAALTLTLELPPSKMSSQSGQLLGGLVALLAQRKHARGTDHVSPLVTDHTHALLILLRGPNPVPVT